MTRFETWFKRRTIYRSILFSYLLMLLVPVFIETFSYVQYSALIEKETEVYNLSLLRQSQRVLDDRLESIEEVTLNLSLDSDVQTFINVLADMDSLEKYNLSKLILTINRYKKTNSFIDGIYIYFPKSGAVVTETAKTTVDDFDRYVYRYTDWAFDDWKYSINQMHSSKYRMAQIKQSDASRPQKVICLMQTVYQGSIKQTAATIVVSIDAKRVEDLLSDSASVSENLFVFDQTGDLIFGLGTPVLYDAIPKDKLAKNDSFFTEVQQQQYFVSSVVNSKKERKYVSITSVELIRHDIQRITESVIIVTLALIAIGILLAFFMAKRKYSPIKKLADGVQAKMEAPLIDAVNEFMLIEWAADAAYKEKEQFVQTMQRQLPVLRSNMLLRLMQGILTVEESALRDIGITFKAPDFCVILVHVDQYRESKLKERSLSKYVISNTLEHLGREVGASYVIDLDVDRVGLLLNMQANNDTAEDQTRLYELSAKVLEFMTVKFETTITISIGGIHEHIEGIHYSYQEALRAMEYQIIKGYSSIIRFDETEPADRPQTYVYPIQSEELLIGSIKHGDIKKVREIMNEIHELNFMSGQLHLEMARCLFFDMMATSIKVLNSSAIPYDKIFADGPQPYKLLTSARTIQEMQAALMLIYEKICSHINEGRHRHSYHLKDRITEYIKENFSDPNLSLTRVAEVFKLSPTYLSGFFKEHVEENFLSYLNQLRIETSKT